MKKSIKVRLADPAGNITIFVLDKVDRSDYVRTATALLEMFEEAEQVAFVTGEDSMEMCGLEFCGNASRAFALMCAQADHGTAKKHPESLQDPENTQNGELIIPIKVSGADGVLEARVRLSDDYVDIGMPVQRSMTAFEWDGISGTLVDLGGIAHLVIDDAEADDGTFGVLKERIAELLDPPALGVMFCSDEMITPIVYVKDVDTIYHEGSCASGATAVAIARSHGKPDGEYSYCARMPEGSLDVRTDVKNGEAVEVRIGSRIMLGETIIAEL